MVKQKQKKIPKYALNREKAQQEPYTKALSGIRKYFLKLSEPERMQFYRLTVDVARILAWGAGHRSWHRFTREFTRFDGEEFGPAVRCMGVCESLATPLWLTMRHTENGILRNALGLVMVRLQLGVAWAHPMVLDDQKLASNFIEEAFTAVGIASDEPISLAADDFEVDGWTIGRDLFQKLEANVLTPEMEKDTVLTEDNAFNDTVRIVFQVDEWLPDGRGFSPCFDTGLRNMRETGVKGVFCEVEKLFGTEIAQEAFKQHNLSVDDWKNVEPPPLMKTALALWSDCFTARVEEFFGRDVAQELQHRCYEAFAFGRAITPAYILLGMVAEKRWKALAANSATDKNSALTKMLERGGSWPSILPPDGVKVASINASSEPTQKQAEKRNRWTGREMSWYLALILVVLMFYCWYLTLGQNVDYLGMPINPK